MTQDLPFYYDGQCSDPYQDGCKEDAKYYRLRTWLDNPDMPEFLCEDCFDCLVNDGDIDPSEWKSIKD
jgi:hypothetical protein